MSMTKLAANIQALKQYGFKDENGHPLENCQEFVELEIALKCDQIGDTSLSLNDKEGVKAAVLQSAIQNPHQEFPALAYSLCSALEKVNRFDEPRASCCVSDADKSDK